MLIKYLQENDCDSIIDYDTAISLLPFSECQRYASQLSDRHLLSNSKSWRYCRNDRCDRVIRIFGEGRVGVVACECGETFCAQCGDDVHFPASCKQAQIYVKALTEYGTSEFLFYLGAMLGFFFRALLPNPSSNYRANRFVGNDLIGCRPSNGQLLCCALQKIVYSYAVHNSIWWNTTNSSALVSGKCVSHNSFNLSWCPCKIFRHTILHIYLVYLAFTGDTKETPYAREESERRVKVKRCPSCYTPMEKNFGCNHMMCRCGTEFCWECNELWSSSRHYQCSQDKGYEVRISIWFCCSF